LIFLIGFTVLKLSSSVREYGSHHKYKTGSRRSLRIYSKIKIHAFRTVIEHLRRVLELVLLTCIHLHGWRSDSAYLHSLSISSSPRYGEVRFIDDLPYRHHHARPRQWQQWHAQEQSPGNPYDLVPWTILRRRDRAFHMLMLFRPHRRRW
jgi:hypothetical protein